jgi:ATP/maltotriose-dependent transcriptional regulator MalT
LKALTPGTREWTLTRFDTWISEVDKKHHKVLILSAAAGLGKTTIASKIAQDGSTVVVAHHFCHHVDSTRDDPKRMLLSLAYQIAAKFPDYLRLLWYIIEEQQLTRDDLLKENLVAIFDMLFRGPLNSMSPPETSHVILIDALGQCQHEGTNSILDCIQQNFVDLPSWLRLFVTTRPEALIMAKLKKFNPELIEPEGADNRNDMRLFFGELIQECGLLEGTVLDGAVETLVDKSQGLFIYASLYADTIRDGGGNVDTAELAKLPTGIDELYEKQFKRIMDY